MELFKRSVYCGHVSESFVEKEVFLCGWVYGRRDLGGLIFIDLRDRTGIVQLVFNPELDKELAEKAGTLRSEFVISVRGKILRRSEQTINKNLKTGEFEIQVLDLSIVSESKTPPFEIEDDTNASEELRLTYRYLDLRRPKMHRYIKFRHKINFSIRNYLDKLEFYEIETPLLSKSTPEGARDFLVPSRLQKKNFYALPQSPQLYKQLLMSAGMEKYFQIARCFRDEDFRANRQPEFTQLDIEMSFVNQEDVMNVAEGVVSSVFKDVLGKDLALPFERMKYEKAFSLFGSDKPDTRFDLKIEDVTKVFENTGVKFLEKVIDDGGKIGALHLNASHLNGKEFSRSEFLSWEEKAKKHFGAKGLLWIKINDDGTVNSPISKILPEDFFARARDVIPTLAPKDILFIVADSYKIAWTALGRMRIELAKELNLIKNSEHKFLWITDFPMFEWSEDDKRWYAMHHPFTLPKKGWESAEIEDIKANAYDLVCNGEELAGGSVRIYDPIVQKKIFELIGISEKEAEEKFGFLLKAQDYGFPPHAGIAVGIDRLVMTITKTESIRDVIAFPKTGTGSCLMTKSPSEIDKKQLKELGF